MDNSKSLGIMAYIDNSPVMMEEFSWLYKSWIYSGCWQTSDLIIVHHPDIAAQLPSEPGVILISQPPASQPGTIFEHYPFINSIACLSGEHVDHIALRYHYLLRTDADVFLTPHLAHFRPSFPVHGRGLYYENDAFRENMLIYCARYGVEHRNHFGCGHSLLAPSAVMVPFLRRQIFWCEKLLEDFGESEGTWPGWFRGVCSMYAAEIAANENWAQLLYKARERVLDVQSNYHEQLDAMVFHIHAIHTDDYFSKFQYCAGAYAHITLDSIDRSTIPGYCHWLAAASVEQVIVESVAGYECAAPGVFHPASSGI